MIKELNKTEVQWDSHIYTMDIIKHRFLSKSKDKLFKKSLKIPKGGNQNPYIEDEQTTQWAKEKVQNDKQQSTKHTHKTKDRITRSPLKTGGAPEG